MKSVQSRFRKIQNKNPNLGDYICLMQAVRGQMFNRETISRWFNKLIPRDDYYPSERNQLVTQLYQSSNCTEDTGFEGKIATDGAKDSKDDTLVEDGENDRK